MPEIKPRVPRPLTDAERKELRKRNGGKAKPEQLAKLTETFGKPRERKTPEPEPRRKPNNGWSK